MGDRLGDDLQDQIERLCRGHSDAEIGNALGSALARHIADAVTRAGRSRSDAVDAVVGIANTMVQEITENWGNPVAFGCAAEARQ